MGYTRSKFDQEMEDMGFGYEQLFLILFSEIDYVTTELLKHIIKNDVCMKYNLLITSRKMLDVWQSIHLICNNNMDYTSLIALSRATIDNYAFLHLLFVHTSSIEERETRLLLYVLDGLRLRRENVQSMSHSYDRKYITQEEENATKKQCEESVISDSIAESNILNRLGVLLKGEVHHSLIDKTDWKYKDYKQQKSKANSFSWTELYALFASSNDMTSTYMGYFSQFVHGLGISTMQYGIMDDSVDFIYTIATSIMDKTKEIIYSILASEIKALNIDYLATDMAKFQAISLYTEGLKNKTLSTMNNLK